MRPSFRTAPNSGCFGHLDSAANQGTLQSIHGGSQASGPLVATKARALVGLSRS